MKRKRHSIGILLLSLIMVAVGAPVKAQTTASIDEYRCRIYSYYVDGAMNNWVATLNSMESRYTKDRSDGLLFEIVKCYYGYIPYALNREYMVQADSMLDRAFQYLNRYQVKYPKDAEAIAIYSSFLGFRLAIHPFKALTLGVQSKQLIAKAMDMAPNNPWVLLEQANALLYTPSLFGGNPEQALKIYNQSIALIEKQGNTECSWNYLNAYINLAYCQIKLKQYAAAQQTYNRLLTIAPNFRWVKQELVPNLQKKIANARMNR